MNVYVVMVAVNGMFWYVTSCGSNNGIKWTEGGTALTMDKVRAVSVRNQLIINGFPAEVLLVDPDEAEQYNNCYDKAFRRMFMKA